MREHQAARIGPADLRRSAEAKPNVVSEYLGTSAAAPTGIGGFVGSAAIVRGAAAPPDQPLTEKKILTISLSNFLPFFLFSFQTERIL